jgi:zinc/manganese transport system substrate-binding protein
MRTRRGRALLTALLVAGLASGCSVPRGRPAPGSPIRAVASISAWGSILGQLGGTHVHVTAIIDNPDTDPHDYEPTTADGRAIADSQLFVENGIGYDTWAAKALAANPEPGRIVVDVGRLTDTREGANPHRWYSPGDVDKVAAAITSALERLDPTAARYFDARRAAFETSGLKQYHQLLARIAARYAGTPVGASESVFTPLADALKLDVLTPPAFLKAVSEGSDPSPSDKERIDAQIREHKIKVYVYNTQNATPDVRAQVDAARSAGIPVVPVTESLTPAHASFQEWQSRQLEALLSALAQASA